MVVLLKCDSLPHRSDQTEVWLTDSQMWSEDVGLIVLSIELSCRCGQLVLSTVV